MNHVHIAIFDRSHSWLIMKEEIYTSLFYWLSQLGYNVTMATSRLESKALNIIVGLQYLSKEQIRTITKTQFDFGLFDVEFVAEGMVNFKPETSWLFAGEGRRFFERCRFFLSYFKDSVAMLRDLGVFSQHFVPGYCPLLETAGRISEADKSIDVLFFGNVDNYRQPMLERIAKGATLTVRTPKDVTPLFLRNALAQQARIVLSLGRARPFGHIGPMRLVAMAHLRAFSLSEAAAWPQPEINDLCAFFEHGQDPLESILAWLHTPALRQQQAEAAYARIRGIDPLASLGAALEYRP